MKKVLAKIILAFVIFLITMNIQYQSNAYTYSSDSGIYMADLTIDPSQYKPEPQQNTKMNSIVGTILGALQIIGGFAIVLGIAVVGFQILLGSANDKADGSLDDVMNNGNSFLNAGSESSTMIDQNDLKSLSNFISGVLLTIAIGVTVITGAIMGLNFITQSIEEKAKVKESMVPWVIGIIVSFGAFTIWEVAVNLFQSL